MKKSPTLAEDVVPTVGKLRLKKVGDIVSAHIAATGSGIPGGWSLKYPWSGGIIKAEGGPEEIVQYIAATLRANGEEANTDEIARWALQNVWLKRAGPERWKGKFETSGKSVNLQTPPKPDKLTPREYGSALWGLGNLLLAMPPKERPIGLVQWLEITGGIIASDSVGCSECAEHFTKYLGANPLMPDYTDEQMRVWMWLAHDNASALAKNHRQPYNRIAKNWQWPELTEEEFNRIRKSL